MRQDEPFVDRTPDASKDAGLEARVDAHQPVHHVARAHAVATDVRPACRLPVASERIEEARPLVELDQDDSRHERPLDGGVGRGGAPMRGVRTRPPPRPQRRLAQARTDYGPRRRRFKRRKY